MISEIMDMFSPSHAGVMDRNAGAMSTAIMKMRTGCYCISNEQTNKLINDTVDQLMHLLPHSMTITSFFLLELDPKNKEHAQQDDMNE